MSEVELTFTLAIYRKKRCVARRLEARGNLVRVLEDAARLLVWHNARRVTVRTPGGRYLPAVVRRPPASSPPAALFADLEYVPTSETARAQASVQSERSERSQAGNGRNAPLTPR